MNRPTDEELAAAIHLLRHPETADIDEPLALDLARYILVDAAIADAEPITPEALEREGWWRTDLTVTKSGWRNDDLPLSRGRYGWLNHSDMSFSVAFHGEEFGPVTTMGELRTLMRILGRVQ